VGPSNNGKWIHLFTDYPAAYDRSLSGFSCRFHLSTGHGCVMNDYRVNVSKDYLVFASSHFITYGGGKCEPLHGHNYRAGVTLWGELDQHALVYDFVTLKREMLAILEPLDHRMLLPTGNPNLSIAAGDGKIEVRTDSARYVFPEADVTVLPIPNTTAELIATWILDRLVERLDPKGVGGIRQIEVEVEESFGQSAFCRRRLEP
jgi:6-pyruvoyltetrahydropterin/6-carboxytetrahydropterin synthase